MAVGHMWPGIGWAEEETTEVPLATAIELNKDKRSITFIKNLNSLISCNIKENYITCNSKIVVDLVM